MKKRIIFYVVILFFPINTSSFWEKTVAQQKQQAQVLAQKKMNKEYADLLKQFSDAPRLALLSLAAQGKNNDICFLLKYNKKSRVKKDFSELVNCTGYPERDYPISPTDTPIKNALGNKQLKTAALLVSFGANIAEQDFYRIVPYLDEQTIKEERFTSFINTAIQPKGHICNVVAASMQARNVPVVKFLAEQEGFSLHGAFVNDQNKPRDLVARYDKEWNMVDLVEDIESQDVKKIGELAKVAATYTIPQSVVVAAFASPHPQFQQVMEGKPLYSTYIKRRKCAVAKSFQEVSQGEL